MKNKSKKSTQSRVASATHLSDDQATDLYELITQSTVLEANERDFWLENYESLPTAEQLKLARILSEAAVEQTQESDAHLSRLAEIKTKYAMRLTKIEKANERLLSAHDASIEADYKPEEFDPDAILDELRRAGEF